MIFCKAIPAGQCPPDAIVLAPANEIAQEKIRAMKGKEFAITARRGRSLQQHKLYFVALHKVFQNQNMFNSEDELRHATLVSIGYSRPYKKIDGGIVLVPKSMDFRLAQDDFQEKVFNPSLELWCGLWDIDPLDLTRP